MRIQWNRRQVAAAAALSVLVALSVAYVYGNGLNGPPIRSDGFGYHAFLPSLIIHRDVTFTAFVQSLAEGYPAGAGLRWREDLGVFLNKYPVGTALLEAPFFIVADNFVLLTGGDRSGLSTPYQIANIVSGATWFVLGTLLVWRALSRFFEGTIVAWTLVVVVFGTNVFHYASYDASFSHIYSYFLVAAYLLALLRYRAGAEGRGAPFLIGILLGLIVITRVPNGIVGVMAAAAWLDARRGDALAGRGLRDLAWFAAGLGLALLPLALYWYAATGSLIVYTYGEEGFAWQDPALAAFLFSVSKGLLFWAPLLVLAVPGFFLIPAGLRPWFSVSAPIAVALQVYLCASWQPWDFGGSYGSRPFVEFMPILAIPIAATLARLRAHWLGWSATRIVVALLILLNLFLMHSYWRGFVPFRETTFATLAELPGKYAVLLGFEDPGSDR